MAIFRDWRTNEDRLNERIVFLEKYNSELRREISDIKEAISNSGFTIKTEEYPKFKIIKIKN